MNYKKMKILSHGTVLSMPDLVFGYCAWPSVTLDDNSNIIVACSGGRLLHICPFGKVLTTKSVDLGKTWSAYSVAVNTPLDDRDAGIINLGSGKLLISTFNNTRKNQEYWADNQYFGNEIQRSLVRSYLRNVTDDMECAFFGSLLSLSKDGGFSWSTPHRAPVTAPHGPNLWSKGIIYAGNKLLENMNNSPIIVYSSENLFEFNELATIPRCPQYADLIHTEPHIIEIPKQDKKAPRLLLQIRVESATPVETYDTRQFSIVQSISDDEGKTWTMPEPTFASGAPPHLLLHSSGIVISCYGHRKSPFGIMAMLSDDRGDTWDTDYLVWDNGIDYDLGYPASVELWDGSIFTVYYAKKPNATHASILWTRWQLP